MNVEITLPTHGRPYQRDLVKYFRDGGKQAYCVWHRKAGKDRVATFIESELAMSKPGLYWHALPQYADGRKVVWDAITLDGQRLIDACFPREIVKSRNNTELKLELVNGSIWQVVGADRYNDLVGAFPSHITFSEYALMGSQARNFLRPALAMGGGSELLITTPRGYNHAYDLWQHARASPHWYTSLQTVEDTGILSAEALEEERASKSDELFLQEYMCDWSVANPGAILARYVDGAEKAGRIGTVPIDHDQPVYAAADIGFHDTTAWWFWQVRPDGVAIIDYEEDSGLDAGEWIERIGDRYPYKHVFLPHDAKARTFATRKSALEQFLAAGLPARITPALSKSDQIEAGRMLAREAWIDEVACARGLVALRAWSYDWNEANQAYSRAPRHDWASHAGDAWCYMALASRPLRKPQEAPAVQVKPLVTIDQFIAASSRTTDGVRRI